MAKFTHIIIWRWKAFLGPEKLEIHVKGGHSFKKIKISKRRRNLKYTIKWFNRNKMKEIRQSFSSRFTTSPPACEKATHKNRTVVKHIHKKENLRGGTSLRTTLPHEGATLSEKQ